MRPFTCSLTAAALSALLLLTAASPALAQEMPPPAPPPPVVYVAPMYQQTQPSYVPQSVAMSGPRIIKDWHDGDPIPPGYHPDTRSRKGLVIGGAITFGLLYLLSAFAASIGADSAKSNGGPNGEALLWIPGAGPFAEMPSGSSSTGNLFLAIDGIGQVAGLAMLGYGLASPQTVLVRNDLGSLSVTPQGVHVMPRPMTFGQNGGGLGVVGTF